MDLHNLTDEERDMVLRFLLHRMSIDTRHALMRTLPLAYVSLYPGNGDTVMREVRAAVERLS